MSSRGKVVAVIQARTGSTRLPGKILMPILGRPMLEHQIERVRLARSIDEIVLATSDAPADSEVLALAKRLGIWGFAGSEKDVLDRVYRAAKSRGAEIVVRLTGDCPLQDPAVIDQLVNAFLGRNGTLDYLGIDPSFPEGLDVEVMTLQALERAWHEASRTYEREHVTVYIWQSGRFRAERISHEPDLSAHRWTVDEEEDFRFVSLVYEALLPRHGHAFGMREILLLLDARPELLSLNRGIVRNEGFLRSLRAERAKLVRPRAVLPHLSHAFAARASRVLAGAQAELGGLRFERARGSRLFDLDGNEYIDYDMAGGAALLGYAHPEVDDAVRTELARGLATGLPSTAEVELAETLRGAVPAAEQTFLTRSGAEALDVGLRLARGVTGEQLVLSCGADHPRAQAGLIVCRDADELGVALRRHRHIAGVVAGPSILAAGPRARELADLVRARGGLVIADERTTAPRCGLGGLHMRGGVAADLVCLGSGVANGLSIGAIAGRDEWMRRLDAALGGAASAPDALAVAAARATLRVMEKAEATRHLSTVGAHLKEGFNSLASDLGLRREVALAGLAECPRLRFADDRTEKSPMRALLQQAALDRGVHAEATHHVSLAHTETDIEATLGAYQAALEILADALRERDVGKRPEHRTSAIPRGAP